VSTLAQQLKRHSGEVVDTQKVAPPVPHPLHVVFPQLAPKKLPTWEAAFAAWRDYVDARPRSTVINYQTPWNDLKLFAAKHGIVSPEALTPVLMNDLVGDMRTRGLAPRTINERLVKIRSIYKIAISRFIVTHCPAANTLGVKESGVRKRRKRRLPFDAQDLNAIFGSTIFLEHRRSRGQSGEASYWIPLLMYYTGARPEEIAGLALTDLREHPTLGWYLNLVDRPSSEDGDLFEGDTRPSADSEELLTGVDASPETSDLEPGEVPDSHRRTLKNAASIRRVPVAPELMDLGLLRYREWLRTQGHTVFFPTLVKDWHGS
jgi:integrase